VEVLRASPLTVERLRFRVLDPDRFAWVAFTSRHAVDGFLAGLRDGRDLAGHRIACLAGATGDALTRRFLSADLVVDGGGADLARALGEVTDAGTPVLFPRAAEGRDELPEILGAAGVPVEVVPVYRTFPDEETLALLARERWDAVAFASPRGAAAFLDAGATLDGVRVGAVGATTADFLRGRGVTVDVVAGRPSLPALVAELSATLVNC
jgi:uroporphyrinogen-III synthase